MIVEMATVTPIENNSYESCLRKFQHKFLTELENEKKMHS